MTPDMQYSLLNGVVPHLGFYETDYLGHPRFWCSEPGYSQCAIMQEAQHYGELVLTDSIEVILHAHDRGQLRLCSSLVDILLPLMLGV